MLMKFLSKQGTTVKLLILAGLHQHLLWNGGVGGLGSPEAPREDWDGTLMGRLHMWMRTMNLELRGPVSTPMARENDTLLVSLCRTAEERVMLATGSWTTDAWRVSDCICLDGAVISSLRNDER